uniref:Sad1 and UNC84 domain containing 1b n=1 Tax=Tetraodon nigroviridis TaxID=99883 RepID=H3C0L4_TETNG
MDFSQLHTYTPPQCAPENTGYTYSLSSSYSTAALEFEQEHQIAAVYESPRMSRRSLRLQACALRTLRNKKQQSGSGGLSLSLSQAATPRKTLSFSAVNTPVNSGIFQESSTATDAALFTGLDESHLRQRTVTTTNTFTCVDGQAGRRICSDHSSGVNGDTSASKAHASLTNGYICKDCSFPSQKIDNILSSSSSSSPFTSVYSRDRSRRSKTGDDCKGKQHAETHSSLLSQSSRLHRMAGTLWGHCLLWPGHCVLRSGKVLGCGAVRALRSLLSLLWMFLTAPVKAGRGLLWFLATGWYQLVSLMTVLNVFFLTQCLPRLWRLLLLLLPFLLLLAVNLTEWRPISPLTLWYNLVPASASVSAPETPIRQTPATPASETPSMLPPVALSGADLERLAHIERQLALLGAQLKQTDHKQDERHGNILELYNSLKDQLHTRTDRESLGGSFNIHCISPPVCAAQSEEQQESQQRGQATRLAEIEVLLNTLAAKTQEVQQKQKQFEQEKRESTRAVKQEDHAALLLDVQRLEAELGKIRQDLQAVVGCRGKCEQLDTLKDTVSAQVRKELQTLFFGSGGTGELPESLLHWLSQRYVSSPDLQALLASLEMSILRNVSLQLEHSRVSTLGEAESQVSGAVQHTAATEGLPEEQVKIIVQNALRLYSQDRTGLVDYALESGGGSILSTRCSETYETKTALMSLFGLPLWYFSQSPRVVIQPDVYPGNCWAFKGSQGYLVIRLSLKIVPTSFCLEHIPRTLSPTGNITSAPRDFTVFGLDDEYQEEGKLLGQYTYQEDGDALQMFPVQEQNDKSFQIIEMRVLSNWGHQEYTCLYRFRVHGNPQL